MASAATSRALVPQKIEEKKVVSENIEMPRSSVNEQSMNEQIQQLAYSLWEQRGCPEGTPEQDWTEAETQLLSSRPKTMVAGR